ncbi:MAG: type II/IV secretion system ATPase subunit [Candidatus Thermoplasmatota archaeon]|nr:type II/IV secretion system ATPase subunit [Candidatus Thermoplasmatota archaeon]
MPCDYQTRKEGTLRMAVVRCDRCGGPSTLLEAECRKNLLEVLLTEARLDRIVLRHPIVKVFDGPSLSFLRDLVAFIRGLDSCRVTAPEHECEECSACREERRRQVRKIHSLALTDPVAAFQHLRDELAAQRGYKKGRSWILAGRGGRECVTCRRQYADMLAAVLEKRGLNRRIVGSKSSDHYYRDKIQPYVRPVFFDTYVKLSPPQDAVFQKKYRVEREGGRSLDVFLYSLVTRPENMYFVIPPEYHLPVHDLHLLQRVKEQLARHRPRDPSFMDPAASREYFLHFAREHLRLAAEEQGRHLSREELEGLSDIFAKYTAGLGILEDLLLDEHVQDIYINAPVANNPLHLIVDGEEYTSNIYFSEGDVQSLSSRFRSLSGRPFSEGSPILDMALDHYDARVAAISPPLTEKGVAFALRRHGSTPWTLPKFIRYRMFSSRAAGLLSFLVDGQASMLIAGSRGSGKTSLLSALLLEIPQRYRILTLEDTPELPVDDLQEMGYKIQSLVTRPITSGGQTGVDPRTALRTALRLGESVLVLGEVRGQETRVLFEAMRVGAAGNLVLGTIHGATARDVFERIVHDIGVAPTSFKATDVVTIAAPLRMGGGMEKRRRVLQISEVSKGGWGGEADPDAVFADLMAYRADRDELLATDRLDMGQSEVLGRIAREWGMSMEQAIENVALRTRMRETMVRQAERKHHLVEAEAVRDANNAFWMLTEESRQEHGQPDYPEIERRWKRWFREYAGRIA